MKKLHVLALLMLILIGCKERGPLDSKKPSDYSQAEITEATAHAKQFFDRTFMEEVKLSPEWGAYLGVKDNADKWDEYTDEAAEIELNFKKDLLKKLKDSIQFHALDSDTQLSYKLFEKRLQDGIDRYKWRHYGYPVNQMYGTHTKVPSFMANAHSIDNEQDAKDYISRLNAVPKLFDQGIADLKVRASKNIIPPKFVFPKVLESATNVLEGLESKDDKNVIYSDFKKKLGKLKDLPQKKKDELLAQCQQSLTASVKPAYEKLIAYLGDLEKQANTDDGAWKFENGIEYYNHRLKAYTTTDLTAEEIHSIGLEEMKRIHKEMEVIKDKVGFKGDLQAFFKFMREDNQFYYADSKKGRDAYMKDAEKIIDEMRPKLNDLFITKPKAELVVKRVEAYREKAAGKAFYMRPKPDGSRPGIYYANMYSMKDMPKYQMEALAYHEAIPGHHMQLSIAQELGEMPKFRKYGSYTAYIEGWGLYSEYIPKELGFYSDPYSDFGRLAMELWRACRLVVDSGIHFKKWNRDKSIKFYMTNTPNSEGDCIKMVERHIVRPGQATAYKIGMIKILELREEAKKKLADKFDIREFHEVVLTNGALPLDVLEDLVNIYIEETLKKES